MTAPIRPGPGVRSDEQARVLRGLGLLAVAMVLLPAQDAVAKFISDVVSPGQITWVRFLLQVLLTLPFLIHAQGLAGIVPNRLWPNLVRGALIAVSSTLFFAAIKFMPIADALAIFFIEPFILTILSAVIEKEHVGWRRRIAVAIGFVGVLIVVQPSYAVFGATSLLPAAAGGIFAVYVLMSRRQASFDTPLTMQLTAGVSAVLVMSVALAGGWTLGLPELAPTAIGWREAGFLLLMGVFGTGGHFLFVQASKLTPGSLIAPMQYVEIVAAAAFGLIIFGDFPNALQWLGILIIVASGGYVFWRESRVREAEVAATAPTP